MTRPRVVDGDDLQTWKVAADVLKKLVTAKKGWGFDVEIA